jgi:hypothetical protein
MAILPQSARFGDRQQPLKVTEELYDIYDYAEFVVGNGVSDYDVAANQSALFANCKSAWLAVIEYNKNISIKFNDTSMPAITCGYDTSPREWRNILKIKNMFITNNSGAVVTLKVLLV